MCGSFLLTTERRSASKVLTPAVVAAATVIQRGEMALVVATEPAETSRESRARWRTLAAMREAAVSGEAVDTETAGGTAAESGTAEGDAETIPATAEEEAVTATGATGN